MESGTRYQESATSVQAVRSAGACLWVLVGFVALTALVAYWPVSGLTDAPVFSRTLLYLSTGHHFVDVDAAARAISPPPPSF